MISSDDSYDQIDKIDVPEAAEEPEINEDEYENVENFAPDPSEVDPNSEVVQKLNSSDPEEMFSLMKYVTPVIMPLLEPALKPLEPYLAQADDGNLHISALFTLFLVFRVSIIYSYGFTLLFMKFPKSMSL